MMPHQKVGRKPTTKEIKPILAKFHNYENSMLHFSWLNHIIKLISQQKKNKQLIKLTDKYKSEKIFNILCYSTN